MNTCDTVVIVQGQTKTLRGQVLTGAGALLDMTPDGSLKWYLSSGLTKTTAAGTILWDNQSRGLFHLVLSSAETLALPAVKGATYHHELWATTPSGEVGRIWSGELRVVAPITTPT